MPHEAGELAREAPAELLDGRIPFALADLPVLCPLRGGPEALPRQAAPEEMQQHVAYALQVVPAARLQAVVHVEARVAHRARHALPPRGAGYVLVGLRVPEPLRQAEVHDVDAVAPWAQAREEVVRLDVAVHDAAGVHALDAVQHLLRQQQHGPEAETPAAAAEELLERGAQQLHDHGVVLALHAVPAHAGHAAAAREAAVELRLGEELAALLGVDPLELHGNLVAHDPVEARKHFAVGAGADHLPDLEPAADQLGARRRAVRGRLLLLLIVRSACLALVALFLLSHARL
mmetsp:Transcript_34681/g.110201  ORF Transcript_34681/g.110201 Transcript_34681/m.110201 type:complete len:290 (-) Transcript_34681:136-1005(-)